jgi:hypothetical protein
VTSPLTLWLAQQINRIDSVQRCTSGPEADIIVHSWRGIIIYVHIVDSPLKTRQIRKMAQDATRNGIGTLFVVNAALLPPDGARTGPDEWLMAIHALMDEKVYAYRIDARGPHIFQVHFKATTKSDERDVWYGEDIPLRQLPFYRIWVKMNAMKGDYLIANFDGVPFWHNKDYRSARADAFDKAQRASRGGEYARFAFSTGGVNGPELTREPDSPLARSYAALGLKYNATCEEVKAAFRRLALEVHPDTSKLPKAEAETRFRAITEAYNTIRDSNDCH